MEYTFFSLHPIVYDAVAAVWKAKIEFLPQTGCFMETTINHMLINHG
jgi:hypothetical protein